MKSLLFFLTFFSSSPSQNRLLHLTSIHPGIRHIHQRFCFNRLITTLYSPCRPTERSRRCSVLKMIYTKAGSGGGEYSCDLLVRELTDKAGMWFHDSSGIAWSGISCTSTAGNHCPSGNLSVYKSAGEMLMFPLIDCVAAPWQCSHVSLQVRQGRWSRRQYQ